MHFKIAPAPFVLGTSLVLSLVLAACGGPPPAENPPAAEPVPAPAASVEAESAAPAPTASASASAEPAPAPAPAAPALPAFDSLSAPEKMDRMKTVVMPKMKALFQEFDAKEFANFSCATCHGKGAKSGNFKMPNASLPKLDFSDNMAAQTKAHPEMMKFMGEKVVPEMAKTLGEEPYNHETGKGFGCLGCHTKK